MSIWKAAVNEWKTTRLISKWGLFLIPLTFALVVSSVYIHGTLSDLNTIVVDQDKSALSRQFIRMTDAHRYLKVIATEQDPQLAFKMLRQRKAYMVEVIPVGFERSVLQGKQGRIQITHFGANMMIGKTMMKAMAELTIELNAKLAARGLMAMRGESAFTQRETPPLQVVYHNLYNPSYNYLWMLPPGVIITLWQMFIVLWMINSGVSSLKQKHNPQTGILARIISPMVIPAGAMTAHYLFFFYILCPLLGLPVRGAFITGFAAWLLFLPCCMCLGLAIAWLFEETLGASMMAMSITAPAFVFSGYTYPFSQMPLFHRLFAQLMPSTHYLPMFTGWFYQGSAMHLIFRWGMLIYLLVVSVAVYLAGKWRLPRVNNV
ncbi:MAG: ABC transporter permease [Candidatus Cloacimonas sp.]|jgi:ABC-2 type transport system permease protein|nr:ABC transporter permease [Candidatus Cloacimonas sp.]